SQTALETYLLNAGIKTKVGNPYSRFALRTILTNPVYMLNDEVGFDYFKQKNIPIYSENSDGRHGFIAYNKTKQESGKSMKYNYIEEWIISVGEHRGIVSGKDWVQVQSILEKNKDKSYRKPKNSYALLSGVLFCGNCGSYMRPKPSQRTDENGQRVFAYLCELKEKSKGHQCNMKRANGNELDKAVIEEIKKIASDQSKLIELLIKSQSNITSSFKETEKEITALEKNMKSLDDKIGKLVMSLANAESQTAQKYVYDEIDKLHAQKENLQRQIEEKKTMLGNGKISATEFERLADMLSSFAESVDSLSTPQKQDLIKALIKRIEWDGENVRIYFFGAEPQCEDCK
ncbi:MAG: recombinase zinc beta ribbon domain-containing protein, partial [Hominimerdicola sp.]